MVRQATYVYYIHITLQYISETIRQELTLAGYLLLRIFLSAVGSGSWIKLDLKWIKCDLDWIKTDLKRFKFNQSLSQVIRVRSDQV